MSDNASATPQAAVKTPSNRFGDPLVLSLTIGFIVLFVGLSLHDAAWLTKLIGEGFA